MTLFLLVFNAGNWQILDRPPVPFHGKTTRDQLWFAGHSREYLEAVIVQRMQEMNPSPLLTWTIDEVQEIPPGYR